MNTVTKLQNKIEIIIIKCGKSNKKLQPFRLELKYFNCF